MSCRRTALPGALALVFCITLLTVASGCRHEPRSGVHRSSIVIAVQQQGSPLKAGVVDITNKASGEGASGALDDSGTVTLTGVSDGEYVVMIQPPPSLAPDGSELPKTGKFTVSPRYRDAESSPLSITVNAKQNSFELEVE